MKKARKRAFFNGFYAKNDPKNVSFSHLIANFFKSSKQFDDRFFTESENFF